MKLQTQKKVISVISTAVFAFMSAPALANETAPQTELQSGPAIASQIEVSPYHSAVLKYQSEEAKMASIVGKLQQENVALADTSVFTKPSLSVAVTDEQAEQVNEELRAFFGDAYLEDAHDMADGYDISYIEALQALKRQEWLGDINQALIDGEQEQYGGVYFDSTTQQATILLPDSASVRAKSLATELRQTGDINVVDTHFTMLEMEDEARRIMAELKQANPDIKVQSYPDLKKQRLVVQVETSPESMKLVENARKDRLHINKQSAINAEVDSVIPDSSPISVAYEILDQGSLTVQQYGETTGNRIYWSPFRHADLKCSSSFHVVSEQGHEYGSSASHCADDVSFSQAVDGTQGVKKFAFGWWSRRGREHLIDLAFYDYPGYKFLPETKVRHGSIHARDSKGKKISAREIRSVAKRGDIFPGLFVCKFGGKTGRTCGDVLALGRWDKFQPDGSTLPGLETLMIGSLPKHGHAVFSAPGDSGSGIFAGYRAIATMWGGLEPEAHRNIPNHPGLTDITWAIPAWYAQNELFSDIRKWHNIVRTYARDIGYRDFTRQYDEKWSAEVAAGFNHNLDYFYMTVDNAPSNCTDYGLSIVQVRADSITCGLPIPSAQPNPSGSANNSGVGRPRMTSGVGSAGGGRLNGAIFGSGVSSRGTIYGGSSRQTSTNRGNGSGFPKATVNTRNGDNCNVRWCQHVRPTPRYGLAGMEHGFGWEQTFNQSVSCAALNSMDTIELARHDTITTDGRIRVTEYYPEPIGTFKRNPQNIDRDYKCTTMREYFAN